MYVNPVIPTFTYVNPVIPTYIYLNPVMPTYIYVTQGTPTYIYVIPVMPTYNGKESFDSILSNGTMFSFTPYMPTIGLGTSTTTSPKVSLTHRHLIT